jgi:putative transposase
LAKIDRILQQAGRFKRNLGLKTALNFGLDTQQRQTVIAWLKQKDYWNLSELQQHIEDTYAVVFASNQSYYELFAEADISWKKTQKRNPKAEPEVVEKKNRKSWFGWKAIDMRLLRAN